MYNQSKLLFSITLVFLLLVCKDSKSQDTTNATEDQVVTLKKRPTSPPIKVMRELMVPDRDAFPYIVSETYYDENGKIISIKEFDYYGSGREVGTTTNTISPQGNIVSSIENDDGNITYYSYEYNAKNQKTKESWKRDNGQGSTSQFTYNEHGDLIEEKVFTADMKEDFSRAIEYEYDLNGNILVEKKWEKYLDGTVDLLQYHFTQEFEDNKVKIKMRYNEAGNPTRSEEFIYNELGLKLAVVEGSSLGIHKTEYSYNEYGELTDEKISSVEDDGTEEVAIHNVTRYDTYGNNLGSVDGIGEKGTKTLFEYEF